MVLLNYTKVKIYMRDYYATIIVKYHEIENYCPRVQEAVSTIITENNQV